MTKQMRPQDLAEGLEILSRHSGQYVSSEKPYRIESDASDKTYTTWLIFTLHGDKSGNVKGLDEWEVKALNDLGWYATEATAPKSIWSKDRSGFETHVLWHAVIEYVGVEDLE